MSTDSCKAAGPLRPPLAGRYPWVRPACTPFLHSAGGAIHIQRSVRHALDTAFKCRGNEPP